MSLSRRENTNPGNGKISMSRSFTCSALALRVKTSGESNREAWFLTAGEGILRATVFGGPKSRLRALVAPFHGGTLWIYHDPVRDTRKVNDFDVQFYRTGLRELYERAMTADAVAETVLSSQGGGGGWAESLELAGSVLDALEAADASVCSRIGVYFLWQWAGHLGLRPDLSVCASCFREAVRDEPLWFYPGREAFFCEDCAGKIDNSSGWTKSQPTQDLSYSFRLLPGARLWLKAVESLPPSSLARFSLDTLCLEQAKTLAKTIMAGALGKALPTWDWI